MNELENPKIAKVKDNITHQGIGGKTIVISREGTLSYILDLNMSDYTIAVFNFVRRYNIMDIKDENKKLYYGHVNGLGYFVAEDEIDGEIKEINWEEAFNYGY